MRTDVSKDQNTSFAENKGDYPGKVPFQNLPEYTFPYYGRVK